MSLISPVTLNRIWNYAKRGVKMAPDFALGTGGEAFTNSLRTAVRGTKDAATGKYVGGTGYSNFWTKLKDAFKASEAHNNSLIAQEGGFFKAMKKNLLDIPAGIRNGWTAGGAAAKAAGKSGLWGSITGAAKSLGTKMPLIGSLIFLAFETPNIIKATMDGGVVDGAAEFVKAGARAVGSMAGFCIGQALCPIPIVGGLIGGFVGEWLTSKLVGKSYSEKKAEQEEKLAMNQSQMSMPGEHFDTGTTNPFATSGMSADQYMIQQLQQAAMQNPDSYYQRYVANLV